MRGEDGLIDTAALVAGVVERATDAVFTYEFTHRNVTGLFVLKMRFTRSILHALQLTRTRTLMTTALQHVSHQLQQDAAKDFTPFNVIITARNCTSDSADLVIGGPTFPDREESLTVGKSVLFNAGVLDTIDVNFHGKREVRPGNDSEGQWASVLGDYLRVAKGQHHLTPRVLQ